MQEEMDFDMPEEPTQHEERLPDTDIHQNLIDGLAETRSTSLSRTSIAARVEAMDICSHETITYHDMHRLIRANGYEDGARLLNDYGRYIEEQSQVQQRLIVSLEEIPAIEIATEEELFI